MHVPSDITIIEAQREDAAAIAAIHLTARRQTMPYLRLAHTDDDTRAYFARVVADRSQAWWVVHHEWQVVAYMLIVAKAKALSPTRLVLWTFRRNERAQAFYEAHGFRRIAETEGDNEEHEPDVQYEWLNAP